MLKFKELIQLYETFAIFAARYRYLRTAIATHRIMKSKVLIGLSLLALGVTSCKKEIEFDQANYDNYVNQAFVVDNIDPYHRWATMGSASATVGVSEATSGSYAVSIYADYPTVGTKPTLLASGTTENGSTIHLKFTYPLSKSMVYVSIVDKNGHRQVKPVAIENNTVKCLFGQSTASSSPRRSSADDNYNVPVYSKPSLDSYDQGTVISDETNTTDNVVTYYKLSNDWTGVFKPIAAGSTSISSPVNIYVTAKWTINGDQRVNGGCNVIVANGGEIVINEGANLSTNDDHNYSGMIYVLPGGKITGKGLLAFHNATEGAISTYSYNGGEINVGTINLNGGTLYNAANAQLACDELLGGASNSRLINQGNAHIGNAGNAPNESFSSATAGLQIWNACQLIVDKHLNLGGESRIDDGGYVECGTLYAGSFNHLAMGHNAFMNIVKEEGNADRTGDIKLNNYGIQGPTSSATGKAIVKFEDVTQKCNYTSGNRETYIFNYVELVVPATYDVNGYGAGRDLFQGMLNGLNWGGNDGVVSESERNATINQESPSYTIDTSECSKGIATGGSGNVEGTPLTYMYCFEDNFPDAGDYDFNDAVLTVTPSVNDKVVTLTVSLKAVGATKTLGAAIRLVGINSSDLTSAVATQPFASPEGQGMGTYNNIDTQETFVPGGFPPNNTSSMVVVLFKDAHWAMNPTQASVGGVQRNFYNTVKRTVNNANAAYVDAPVAIYTLTFNDAEKAKGMLKNEIYDVFIVEPYGSSYWEVHTIPYKTDQVITPMKPDGYAEAYGSLTPWAVAVPITATSNFKYPIEWQVIGSKHSGVLGGAYQTAGHAFGEWAENHTVATDWYEYPTSGLVFE